jgi:hypothetical protein
MGVFNRLLKYSFRSREGIDVGKEVGDVGAELGTELGAVGFDVIWANVGDGEGFNEGEYVGFVDKTVMVPNILVG